MLEYDAARKIAQGLGADLASLRGVVEVQGETARLLPVSERTTYLFGKEAKMSLGLVFAALIMNPLARVHMPQVSWMFLDILLLGLLAWALRVIKNENDGKRRGFPLALMEGEASAVPFHCLHDILRPLSHLWPVALGMAYTIGLLGLRIRGGEFENISLSDLFIMRIPTALVGTWLIAGIIHLAVNAVSNRDIADKTKPQEVPGEFSLIVFLLVFIIFAFCGYFSPDDFTDPSNYPDAGYDYNDDF